MTEAGGPLHVRLWLENLPLAERCLRHHFVCGLAEGDLDPEAFRRYVAQDAFFLRAFAGAYAVAGARSAAKLEHVRAFHELLGGALDELGLHARYAGTLGIELDRVEPYPATAAYVDFLTRSAWSAQPGVTVAAMTPCMRLYAWLGQRLAARRRPRHPYRDWIETYSSPAFESLARRLETLLDELAADGPAVRDAYRYAMRCELDFFSAPLEG